VVIELDKDFTTITVRKTTLEALKEFKTIFKYLNPDAKKGYDFVVRFSLNSYLIEWIKKIDQIMKKETDAKVNEDRRRLLVKLIEIHKKFKPIFEDLLPSEQ